MALSKSKYLMLVFGFESKMDKGEGEKRRREEEEEEEEEEEKRRRKRKEEQRYGIRIFMEYYDFCME